MVAAYSDKLFRRYTACVLLRESGQSLTESGVGRGRQGLNGDLSSHWCFVADSWHEQCQNRPECSAEPVWEQNLSPFTIGVFGLSGVIFIGCFLLPKLDVGGSNPLARF